MTLAQAMAELFEQLEVNQEEVVQGCAVVLTSIAKANETSFSIESDEATIDVVLKEQ